MATNSRGYTNQTRRPLSLPRLEGRASSRAFGGGRTIESFGGGAGPEAYGAGLRSISAPASSQAGDDLRALADVGAKVFDTAIRVQRQDAILGATAKAATARQNWSLAYTERENQASADGKDFAKGTLEAYDIWTKQQVEGLDGLEKQIVTQELSEFGNSVYRDAVTFETGVRKEFRKNQITQQVETARNNVYLRPQDFDRELGSLLTAIEGTEMPAVAREIMGDSARSSLTESVWKRRVKDNPMGAAAVLAQEDVPDLSVDDRLQLIAAAEGEMRQAEAERKAQEREARIERNFQLNAEKSARSEARAEASSARAEARQIAADEREQLRFQRDEAEGSITAGILKGTADDFEINYALQRRLISGDQARTLANFLEAQRKPPQPDYDETYAVDLMSRASEGDTEVVNLASAAAAEGRLSLDQMRQITNDVQEFQRQGGIYAREDVKLGEAQLKKVLEADDGFGFDNNKADKAFEALKMYRRQVKDNSNADPLELSTKVIDVWKAGAGKVPRPRYLVNPEGAKTPDLAATAQETIEALHRGEIDETEAAIQAEAIEMMQAEIDRKAGL